LCSSDAFRSLEEGTIEKVVSALNDIYQRGHRNSIVFGLPALRQAFDITYAGDYIQPIRYLSMILKVPETEEFLSRETAVQEIKLVGPVLAAAVPIDHRFTHST
jgi:hypothetical protein